MEIRNENSLLTFLVSDASTGLKKVRGYKTWQILPREAHRLRCCFPEGDHASSSKRRDASLLFYCSRTFSSPGLSELSGIALCRPSFCVSLVFGVARVAWLPGNGLVIVKECANKLAGRFF